ncbi:hypothetical protein PDM28_14820 [Stenotrophomonas aracearum]|jgi:hypothetical protein|uniref:Uncharacterized protein n=1 Tax=Stenotrophomonas aracearum TaxID=3003272 RepID=A0ABY9YAP7_9GAMM|nr:hypothetical protein [Stenotrophomonas sp. A5588]WNH47937.1 hypothetical protein PDM28_14820 [Stenotrophomonas sp. A5588]
MPVSDVPANPRPVSPKQFVETGHLPIEGSTRHGRFLVSFSTPVPVSVTNVPAWHAPAVIPPADYSTGSRLPFTVVAGGGILRQAEPRPDYELEWPRHVMLAPFSTQMDDQGRVSSIITRTEDGPGSFAH